ncbi:MAG: hypothetical protein NWF03_08935 [Candidatus Bathyarchaeota archaeon]|nr:hypothetical protein [Candidatus Bathyarchaeota archaeon]
MKDWLVIDAFIAGIVLIFLGIYYFKTDRTSWVRSSTSGTEFPEWFTFIFAGTFFIVLASILVLVVV